MAQASWPTAKATQGPSEPSTSLLAPASLHLPPLPPLTAGPLSHVYVLLLVSDVSNSATPESAARQAPLSVGVSRQEDWSRLPFPPPGAFPDPGIEPGSPALQAASLPTELQGKPQCICKGPCKVWSGGQLNYRTSSSEDGLSSSLRTLPVCAHLFPSLHGGNQRAKGPARDDPAGKQQRADSRGQWTRVSLPHRESAGCPRPILPPSPRSVLVLRPPQLPLSSVWIPPAALVPPALSLRVLPHPTLLASGPLVTLTLPLPGLVGPFSGTQASAQAGTITVWFSAATQAWVGLLSPSRICCVTSENSLTSLCADFLLPKTGMKEVLITANCFRHRVSAVEGCIRHA